LRDEFEQHRDRHADRERPERHERMIRHHAVIDVHREERAGEREHVDQQRAERGAPVVAAIAPERRKQPVTVGIVGGRARPGIDPGERLHEHRKTGVELLDLRRAQRDDLRSDFGQDQQISRFVFFFRLAFGIGRAFQHLDLVRRGPEQDAAAVVLAKENDRQEHRRHFMHESLDDTHREAGLLHRCLRLLRRHEAASGQARDQRGLADRLAVMSRHPEEAFQQGVVHLSGRRKRLLVQSRLDRSIRARGIVFHEVLLRGCAPGPRLMPRHGVRLMRRSKAAFPILSVTRIVFPSPDFFHFPVCPRWSVV
jgi:hypothetical protein